MSICKIPKNKKLIFGSGGSRTIIAITDDKKVYKYFPFFLYLNDNKNVFNEQKNRFKLELEILAELTANIVNKKKSDHIVALYKVKYCKEIPKTFFIECSNYVDYLLSKKKASKECMYLYQNYPVILNKGMFVGQLEYCNSTLSDAIKDIIKKPIDYIKIFLDRIIFQIFFTLEVIREKYPNFIHGDLFIRNILVKSLPDTYANKEYYLRYHLDTIYDVPHDGVFIKFNDFGDAQLNGINKKYNPFFSLVHDEYRDVFSILYDLYNGNNLGANSLLSLTKNSNKIKFIKKYFSQFMNTSVLNKIIKNDKKVHLDWDWQKTYDKKFINLIELKSSKHILKLLKNIYAPDNSHKISYEYNK